jgi:fumarate reductase flavoprotein subunit
VKDRLPGETDVIVAGAGGAGIMAAIAAADNGARVLLLEKQPAIGGVWSFRGGTISGAQTGLQFEHGILDDTPDRYFSDCYRFERARLLCPPELLAIYCRRAGLWVDWLDRRGVFGNERQPLPPIFGEGWSTRRSHSVPGPLLPVVSPELDRHRRDGTITIFTGTRVTALVEKKGKVCGLVAERDGRRRTISSGAVVLATGGFGGRPELVKKYSLPRARAFVAGAGAFSTGDGLSLCEKAGARMVNLGLPSAMGPHTGSIPDPSQPGKRLGGVSFNRYPGVIWVDGAGRRVIREDAGSPSEPVRRALEAAEGQVLFIVFDQRVREEQPGPFTSPNPSYPVPGWEEFDRVASYQSAFTADTPEGLAIKMGVPPARLAETILRWNRAVRQGRDLDFGRTELSHPLAKPPYHAILTGGNIVGTGGGPATNCRQQVIHENGRLMPGLFAAGEVCGYQGYGTAMFNMDNFIFGNLAGTEATRMVKRPFS